MRLTYGKPAKCEIWSKEHEVIAGYFKGFLGRILKTLSPFTQFLAYYLVCRIAPCRSAGYHYLVSLLATCKVNKGSLLDGKSIH